MLRKLNSTLLIIAIILGVAIGGYMTYCHFATDFSNSKIVRELGGE